MLSATQGVQSRFGPSSRLKLCQILSDHRELWGLKSSFSLILELAQHKTSKTVWATTPCEKLCWGDQRNIWPLSASPLGPSARIQNLSRHKRDFSAWGDPRRKQEEEEEEEEEAEGASFSRKNQHPSSKASQYEHIVRLSTPRTRSRSSREALRPPHTPQCDRNCPVWHVDPGMKPAAVTPRLLQLASPKRTHPDFQSNRQSVASIVSLASRSARLSERLVQLSLPRLKQSAVCLELGRPAQSIWTVSKAARRATASARVEMLATPKQLSSDYVSPREPEWSRKHVLHT